MGVIRDRNIAWKRLKKLIENPSEVFIIHYSQLQTFDEEYEGISPLISAIVVKSLDESIEKHFAIHLEADKANIGIEEIESSYRDLELRNLKSFNDFVKRYNHITWVHWNMKNIHFGFEAIKHRFEKLFSGLKDRFEEIPDNKKVNLYKVLEDMYGENFANSPDKLASIMKENNGLLLHTNYLTLEKEGIEFEKKNFKSVLNSLDCKVDFICKALKQINRNSLKIVNKNRYAVFIDLVNNPIITFIGWIATVLGLVVGIYSIFN